MAFTDLPQFAAPVELLRRSLGLGRLAHAYLFTGDSLEELEGLARNLAKTLNCERNSGSFGDQADACDHCLSCRKIDQSNHADVQWLRPEMKTRVISVSQIRELLPTVYLKPVEARWKVVVVVAADRLNVQAANAFLKTLEEPPDGTVLLLISTEPQRLLETIRSRCLRVHCGGHGSRVSTEAGVWVSEFSTQAARAAGGGLFGRYRLLDQLLVQLASTRKDVEKVLSGQSLLERYDDVEPRLAEKWKIELTAAIESEYRRRRADLVAALHWWMRDVWLTVRQCFTAELAAFPELVEQTGQVAARLDPEKAGRNLEVLESTQRLLHSNVQEALALEIGLLKLAF